MPKPHAHLQTRKTSLQSFKLMNIKLYDYLRTQDAHCLSSNVKSRQREITPQEEPRRKKRKKKKQNKKKQVRIYFHADAIYKIFGF